MKCPQCGLENADHVRYCVGCGHNLARFSQQPGEKKGSNPKTGSGTAAGVVILAIMLAIILAIAGVYLGWFSSFFPPGYDCSVTQGYIDIQNDRHSDAFLTLADLNGNTVKSLYLPAGASGTVSGICNGRYYLYYQYGKGWDPALQRFATPGVRKKFEDPVDIRGNNYYDVSLVPGSGNARTAVSDENKTEQK